MVVQHVKLMSVARAQPALCEHCLLKLLVRLRLSLADISSVASPSLRCMNYDKGSEGDEARDSVAKGKRKATSRRSGKETGRGVEGDETKRRRRTGTGGATKKTKRSKPLHPYVEVEYEEETEGAAAETMSFNW